jgi:hypothetical protein
MVWCHFVAIMALEHRGIEFGVDIWDQCRSFGGCMKVTIEADYSDPITSMSLGPTAMTGIYLKPRQANKLQLQSTVLQDFVYGTLCEIVMYQSCLASSRVQVVSRFKS